MNNLGNILKERNELQEAEELLSLAVQIQYVQNNANQCFSPAEQKWHTMGSPVLDTQLSSLSLFFFQFTQT